MKLKCRRLGMIRVLFSGRTGVEIREVGGIDLQYWEWNHVASP